MYQIYQSLSRTVHGCGPLTRHHPSARRQLSVLEGGDMHRYGLVGGTLWCSDVPHGRCDHHCYVWCWAQGRDRRCPVTDAAAHCGAMEALTRLAVGRLPLWTLGAML